MLLAVATLGMLALLALLGSPVRPAEGAGTAWTQVDPTAGDAVHSLALSGSSVLGGTYYNGLFRIDGSATQPPSAAAPLAAIERDPGDASSLVAGAWFDGVLVSSDGGQTWTADNGGLQAIDVYSVAFVGGARFAGTSAGVFFQATPPGGWQARSAGLEARNVYALLESASTLYAGTEHGVFLSSDLGLTWQAASSGLGDLPVYALALAGSRIVAGTERGISYSDDGGTTWASSDPGLGAMPVRALAVMVADPDVVFAGSADGPFVSQTAGTIWRRFDGGLSGEARKVFSLALAGTNPETVYAGTGAGIWQNSFDPTSPVGGIAELPEGAGTSLGTASSSGSNTSVLAGVAGAVAAGTLALGGAAWYARRRWLS